MSEGADSITQICENSLTTLKVEDDPEKLPPRTISYNTRRPRFGTGNVPLSPYILIDGKKLRSSLAFTKKSPQRRVSFPANDNLLVTGYLEPANPWKLAENVNHKDLISAYKESCIKHNTDPLEIVISQLETLDISKKNGELLNLKGQTLDPAHCEPLEEIFKRVQFDKVDLEATSLNDESSVILFDMLEYYESAKQLNISSNPGIGVEGWHACANLIRKTRCLKHLEAKDIILNEQYMNILSRALRVVCHLHVLNLENCGLSGRSIVTLVAALKMNTGIRELYLADNGLNFYDSIQLGSLLRFNNHIQLLDVSNNNIQDDGVRDILEGLINQINEDKDGKGLNILVLWNNQLTQKSSPYFARIIAISKTLETLNIGKNTLTDELLFIIKDALKKSRVLLQLGIQATELTCDGIVTLSEIIEINQVLQRIDLRNNNIQLTGMKALSSAMKKNRSITKIDLDDKPRMKVKQNDLAQTLHQYAQLVAEVQVRCSENEQNRTIEENSEGSESSRHSILCSTNSRKISLTCQTLPCSLSTMISIQNNASGQSMLEPKRINGGRLRSPALSPASSPIASPIPSPSRSRFVVSRVPETSLCSTDSSTSSSPVTLPLDSSTYLASSASGSSRFRVSVVESASTMPLHKPIVASSEADDTFGLNFQINAAESTDSDDSVNPLRSEIKMNNAQNTENFDNASSNVSYLVSNEVEGRCTPSAHEFTNVKRLSTDTHFSKATVKTQIDDSINSVNSKSKEYCDVQNNQINIPTRLGSMTSIRHVENAESNYNEGMQDIKTSTNVNKDDKSSSCIIVSDKPIISKNDDATKNVGNTFLSERTELQPQTKQKSCIQKHTPNLEKLLALFQHPSCFFPISQLKSRSTLQDSINSLMTRGNKFHCYLNEDRDRIHSMEDSSILLENKSTKSFNISQMLSLKSLTNIFPSFKFEGNLNISAQNDKSCSKAVTEVNLLLRKECGNDLTGIQKEYTDYSNDNKQFNIHIKEQQISVSTLGNQLVPEGIQSKSYVEFINKDLLLPTNYIVSNIAVDNCFKIVNNSLLTHVSESKMIVPLSKFLDIDEYSVLKATINDVKIENIGEVLNKVDSILMKETCDKTLTDSINFTSDSNSLFCNIMYDIRNVNDMYTVNTPNKMHNLVILNLNAKGDVENNSVFNVDNKQNNLACFVRDEECDCNINNKSLAYRNALKVDIETNCLNNKVTKMHSIDNNYKKAFTNVHNMPSNEIERIDICHVNNSIDWQGTIVNRRSEAGISRKDFMYEDINIDFGDASTDLCTSIVYKGDITNTARIQKVIKTYATKDNKYFESSNVKGTKIDNPLMENVMTSTLQKADIMFIRRAYSYMTVLNKSIPRDLIFYIADISVGRTSMGKELTSDNAIKRKTSFHDLPQISNSCTNLAIKKPENIHRNNEASKIEGKSLTTSHVQESMHFHKKQKFQENDDSEIDSECPSKCAKVYSIAPSKKGMCLFKKSNDTCVNPLENIYMFTKFGSNIVQRVKFANSDAISDITHKYLNTIKCAVATTMCSKAAVNTRNNVTVEIISDENTNVAEPSSVIHATSTK